jgi:hypothetical protein
MPGDRNDFGRLSHFLRRGRAEGCRIRLGNSNRIVARIENGQRRIDVVELLDLATALGFEPRDAIKLLAGIKTD